MVAFIVWEYYSQQLVDMLLLSKVTAICHYPRLGVSSEGIAVVLCVSE